MGSILGSPYFGKLPYGFGYIIIRSPYAPYSIYLRGTITSSNTSAWKRLRGKPRNPGLPRSSVTFGLVSGLRVSTVSTVTGIGGVVVAKCRTVSSLLDSSRVFASQKCQQSQGSGGSWSRNAELCRHFWTRFGSSRLKSVNSHRDRGGRGRETQNYWVLRMVLMKHLSKAIPCPKRNTTGEGKPPYSPNPITPNA